MVRRTDISRPLPVPRRYDSQLTRDELLAGAYALFRSRGYHATSIQHLLDQLTLTKGALYHHFPNKKALCLAVIEGPVNEEIQRVWALPIEHAASTRLGVAGCFRRILESADDPAVLGGCPLNNLAQELALTDPAFAAAVGEVFERWCDGVARRLVQDVDEGLVASAIGVEETASFLVAAIEGALCLAKAQQDITPIQRCAHQLDQYLQSIELGPQPEPVTH